MEEVKVQLDDVKSSDKAEKTEVDVANNEEITAAISEEFSEETKTNEEGPAAKSLRDAAFGAMFGAMIGDATGAPIEFSPKADQERMKQIWTLPGGGPIKVGPGQITDDTELAICLLRGLLAGKGKLNMDQVATSYAKWIQSPPFDIGNTLRKSLPRAVKMRQHQAEMVRRAAKKAESQSNGSLMRVIPMSIWGHKLSSEDLRQASEEETVLTHCDPVVIQTVYCYHLAVGHLLRNFGDRQGAVTLVRQWGSDNGCRLLQEWISLIDNPEETVAVDHHIGWIKIAFIWGLSYLQRGIGYREALTEMYFRGGDTDTNGCIIGGLLGAAYGYDALPAGMADKVMAWTPQKGGHKRPKFLWAKGVPDLIDQLLELAPETLTIVSGRDAYPEKRPAVSKTKTRGK